MRRSLFAMTALLTAVSVPALAQGVAPAPTAALLKAVDIPYSEFTLANGLRVIVHEDRKAPIVAVSVWYDVGSKQEPKGKTGFAHLFEHLMFNGSENAPGDFFEPLQQVGATDSNGSTWFDRTNYFETVPTPALDLALFLESDRMGHLLGAVTQEKLDNQRGVVQNEKRQGDNQPYGLVEYAQLRAMIPEAHPYGHSTIGSMADLDAASLETVKDWFRLHYGPNNAVLVLAGDIDAKTARPLVEKYFGDIPRGPQQGPVKADVPTLAKRIDETMKDRVATTRLYRIWAVPGLNDPGNVALDIGATVLGGLASSRLDNELVRRDKTAVNVTADLQDFAQLSFFEASVDVKPGADAAAVGKRLDAIIADLVKNGPTADEVKRVATRQIAERIAGLEAVGGFGGKAVTLAEGELYSRDPAFYKKQLAAYAAATPGQVKQALQKWLSRPVYALTVIPGPRDPYVEAGGPKPSFAPSYYTPPKAADHPLAPSSKIEADDTTGGPRAVVDRSKFPEVGPIKDLDFPAVSRAKLSNGIELIYAQRNAVPITQIVVSFDAGIAADPRDKLGVESLTLAMLDEGTSKLDSVGIAEAQERLGATISANANVDRASVSLFSLSANLRPSIDLLASIIRDPAFAPAEVERLRGQQLARIASEMTQPGGIAQRTLAPILFGPDHPYGKPLTGTGDPAIVAKLTRDDLIAFQHAWLRPDKARIFVVSDRPLDEVRAALDAGFGDWQPEGAAGTKNFTAAPPQPSPRIVLVDRPNSPQSLIYGGVVTRLKGSDELVPVIAANDVLGGNFLSRLNTDLRETKGWSYGVRGSFNRVAETVPYIVQAPVQADKTGPALVALRDDMTQFLGAKGVTPAELDRTKNGFVRELAGNFETAADVLQAMQSNVLYKRPDDYQRTIADRYRALDVATLDTAARAAIDPSKIVWVVVGDAKVVKPQLDSIGLPVEVVSAAASPQN